MTGAEILAQLRSTIAQLEAGRPPWHNLVGRVELRETAYLPTGGTIYAMAASAELILGVVDRARRLEGYVLMRPETRQELARTIGPIDERELAAMLYWHIREHRRQEPRGGSDAAAPTRIRGFRTEAS